MSADQLFDIETVEALDVIAKHFDETPECIEQDGPAVAHWSHGGKCGVLICAGHRNAATDNQARAKAGLVRLVCTFCDLDGLDPTTITIREV